MNPFLEDDYQYGMNPAACLPYGQSAGLGWNASGCGPMYGGYGQGGIGYGQGLGFGQGLGYGQGLGSLYGGGGYGGLGGGYGALGGGYGQGLGGGRLLGSQMLARMGAGPRGDYFSEYDDCFGDEFDGMGANPYGSFGQMGVQGGLGHPFAGARQSTVFNKPWMNALLADQQCTPGVLSGLQSGLQNPLIGGHPLSGAGVHPGMMGGWMGGLGGFGGHPLAGCHPGMMGHPLAGAGCHPGMLGMGGVGGMVGGLGVNPLVGCHPAMMGGVGGMGGMGLIQAVKANIAKELIQDRERDVLQAHLVKKLLKKKASTRNRVCLVQALLSGQPVPPMAIAYMLGQDFIMDHITEGMVHKIMDDSVENRHANYIIKDVIRGRPHLPSPQAAACARENCLIDRLACKAVKRVTHPFAHKRIAKPHLVRDVLETLVDAQNVGYGVCVGPTGIEYEVPGTGLFSSGI
ncbi:hypothetical protein HDU77_008723 [Chytriomyces hyalinus]|nr:hypothetical protein HDU77_008723 [Chytriomyces hyalinus]